MARFYSSTNLSEKRLPLQGKPIKARQHGMYIIIVTYGCICHCIVLAKQIKKDGPRFSANAATRTCATSLHSRKQTAYVLYLFGIFDDDVMISVNVLAPIDDVLSFNTFHMKNLSYEPFSSPNIDLYTSNIHSVRSSSLALVTHPPNHRKELMEIAGKISFQPVKLKCWIDQLQRNSNNSDPISGLKFPDNFLLPKTH